MGKKLRKNQNGIMNLALNGDWTIQNAAILKDELIKSFEESDHVQINFQGITDLDITTLQLLYSAVNFAKNNSKQLELENLNSLHDFLKESGFQPYFEPFFKS